MADDGWVRLGDVREGVALVARAGWCGVKGEPWAPPRCVVRVHQEDGTFALEQHPEDTLVRPLDLPALLARLDAQAAELEALRPLQGALTDEGAMADYGARRERDAIVALLDASSAHLGAQADADRGARKQTAAMCMLAAQGAVEGAIAAIGQRGPLAPPLPLEVENAALRKERDGLRGALAGLLAAARGLAGKDIGGWNRALAGAREALGEEG